MIAEIIPTGILCVLFVTAIIVTSLSALFLFNKWYWKYNPPCKNEILGIFFGTLSLIYSLLVAFVIVAVWQDYEELNNTIEQESDKLNSIITHSSLLPDSVKQILQATVLNYCSNIINEEWKMQEINVPHHPSAIPALRLLVLSYQPQSKTQESVFSVLDENLSDISDMRRERLGHTRSHVPQLVWFVLQTGSVVVIVFTFLFSVSSMRLKKICISFLSGMIAMSLFLVYMLDHPFAGSTQVSSAPYKDIIQAVLDKGNSYPKQ